MVARAAGAVGETAGEAALLLNRHDPSYVAAALHRVSTDETLRQHFVAAGRQRVHELNLDAVTPQLVAAIASVAGDPA